MIVDDSLVTCFIPKVGSMLDWEQMDLMVNPFGWYIPNFEFDIMDDVHDEGEKEEEEDSHLDEVD